MPVDANQITNANQLISWLQVAAGRRIAFHRAAVDAPPPDAQHPVRPFSCPTVLHMLAFRNDPPSSVLSTVTEM